MGKSLNVEKEVNQRLAYEDELYEKYRPNFSKQDYLAKSKKPIPTGYHHLDNKLNYGFASNQLIVLGGASGVGKTALALNIVDNMAKNFRDVFVFSLTASRRELVFRLLSRQFFLDEKKEEGKSSALKNPIPYPTMITKRNDIYADYKMHQSYRRAEEIYDKTQNIFLTIFDRDDVDSIEQIEASVERHIKEALMVPVILVDDLQLLSMSQSKGSTKERVIENARRLKALAKKYDKPVIAISSINHSSYTKPVTRDSFKEFGELESISDVLLGLQPKGVSTNERTSELLPENRDLELVILKNRNGKQGTIPFRANMQFNNIEERFEDFRANNFEERFEEN